MLVMTFMACIMGLMNNALNIKTPAGMTVTLSPELDPRITHVAGTVAYVDSLEDEWELKLYLRSLGVRAPSTYVRLA